MNRAASICNLNEHYDSFTSLHTKAMGPLRSATKPAAAFGGSLMNLSLLSNKKPSHQQHHQHHISNFLDDAFDLTIDSPLTGSLSSLALSLPMGKSSPSSPNVLLGRANIL